MRFADMSFWFALQEQRDRFHDEAKALVRSP